MGSPISPIHRLGWFLAWLAVFACAFALRYAELGLKPFHADEANQATKFGILLEDGTYEYDPHDHHGPTLYYAALPTAWCGLTETKPDGSYRLTEATLRLVPLAAGMLGLLLLCLFRDGFSRTGLLVAGAFIAVCPAMVYYSRYFVQEMMLVAFTLGFLGSLWRYVRKPDLMWALNIGLFVGLMHATKETFVLSCAAALVALPFMGPIQWKRGFKHLPVALFGAAGVSVLFFSSFGTHWEGVVDSVMTYFRMADRAGGEGHEKPWDYYARLLAWQDSQGLKLTEIMLLVLAGLGVLACLVRFKRGLGPFFVVYTAVLFAIYSLIQYKTPWLTVNIIPGLALVGAAFWSDTGWIGKLRWFALPVIGLGFIQLADQACKVSFRYHSDGRNPYAYTQTSTDLGRWLDERLKPLAALQPDLRVHIIHPNPWPLPWELRDYKAGFWTEVPDFPDADVIMVHADLQEDLDAALVGSYFPDFAGLRTSEFLPVYIRADLWPKLVDPDGQTPKQGPFRHEAMASKWQMHLVHDDRSLAAGAARAGFAELDRIEGILSSYIPNSDVSRIKNAAAGSAVIVSPETMECLQIAERMKAATGGRFDVAYKMAGKPAAASGLKLEPERMVVRPPVTGFEVDLGGIGKGFALDKMAVLLRDEHGIEDMLLDATSTALAFGPRPWLVGIAGRKVALKERALSGSGLAVRGDHIIDPRTGAAATDVARVWVLAPNGAESDALSTAAMIDPASVGEMDGVRVIRR